MLVLPRPRRGSGMLKRDGSDVNTTVELLDGTKIWRECEIYVLY